MSANKWMKLLSVFALISTLLAIFPILGSNFTNILNGVVVLDITWAEFSLLLLAIVAIIALFKKDSHKVTAKKK